MSQQKTNQKTESERQHDFAVIFMEEAKRCLSDSMYNEVLKIAKDREMRETK